MDNIGFNLRLENGQFKASLKEAETELGKLGIAAKKVGDDGAKSGGGFLESLKNIKGSALLVAGAVAGTAVTVYNLAKSFLTAAAGAEKNQVAFTTLLKSADKAKVLLGDLQKWANVTPFGMESATAGAKRLLAFGVSAENVIGTLNRLGDASMGDAEILDRLTLAYGKISAKGYASMEELNQMTEAGVPIIQALADQYGVTTTAILKMVETGKVGFSDVDRAITGLTTGSGQFAGMMERQAQTLSGLWSSFEDVMGNASKEIGKEMLPAFSSLLRALNESTTIVPVVTTLFKFLVAPISMFASALANVLVNIERGFGKTQADKIKNMGAEVTRLKDQQKGLSKNAAEYKEIQDQINTLERNMRSSARQAAMDEIKNINDKIKAQEEYIKRKKEITGLGEWEAKQNVIAGEHALHMLNWEKQLAEERLATANKASNKDTASSNVYNGNFSNNTKTETTPTKDNGWIKQEKDINYQSAGFTNSMLTESQSALGQLDGIMDAAVQNELTRIDIKKQARIDALDAEYQAEVERINGSTMSQKQKDAALKAADEKRAREQKAIEDKSAKDKRKIEHEAAKRKKAMDIVNVIIAGAVGMIAAFQMGPIAGAIFAALIGALTAASIGVIASQPLPPLATGTMAVPEDMPAFLHQGEAVVPKPFAEGIRSGEMSLGGGGAQTININTSVQIDGNEIGKASYAWQAQKAANRGVSMPY